MSRSLLLDRLGRGLARTALAAAALVPVPSDATLTTTHPVQQPPFYRGAKPSGGPAVRLPVTLTLPDAVPEVWLPLPALDQLTGEIEAWLASRQLASKLRLDALSPKATPPAVYLGCALDQATGDCSPEERTNVLSVTGGSKEWRRAVGLATRQAGAERTLLVGLQVAPHWIRQRGLKGRKEVALGTGYRQELPWLTSEDTPVWVLQVAGVVVDADGKILRSGAEGIWALRTPFRASLLGARRLLSEEDVEFVRRELRRPDLPGAPLAWEAAVGELTRQLMGP